MEGQRNVAIFYFFEKFGKVNFGQQWENSVEKYKYKKKI